MRMIGTISDERAAVVFGGYLLTQGIRNSVEQAAQGWSVWIENDDHLDRARQELDQFARNPADPRYLTALRAAAEIQREDERAQHRRQRNYIDYRTSWTRSLQAPRPLTIALVILCIVVALLSKLGNDPRVLQWFWISNYVVTGDASLLDRIPEVRAGQVWRLITPILIHYGAMHLIFNMLWLMDLGSAIEQRKGTWFLAVLVLSSAILSNLAQLWWTKTPLAGGMSGVVYALFGYVWMKSRFAPHQGLRLNENTVFIMLAWLILCMTPFIKNIANTAHVVGLLTGLAIGYAPIAMKRLRR